MSRNRNEVPDAVDVVGSIVQTDEYHSEVRAARDTVGDTNLPVDAEAFAQRMECLIEDAGLPPKRARFRALDEMTDLTREQMGDVFGVTKGAMDATASNVAEDVQTRTLGHYALFDYPMNFIAKAEFRAESPADYIERVYFYEFSYADPTPREPGPEPPRYRYCVITEGAGPDRTGYAVNDIHIERYEAAKDAVEYFYEDAYFWSVERADEWRELLEFVYDVDIDTPPEERLNPDL